MYVWSASGRYPSYWNTFLLCVLLESQFQFKILSLKLLVTENQRCCYWKTEFTGNERAGCSLKMLGIFTIPGAKDNFTQDELQPMQNG